MQDFSVLFLFFCFKVGCWYFGVEGKQKSFGTPLGTKHTKKQNSFLRKMNGDYKGDRREPGNLGSVCSVLFRCMSLTAWWLVGILELLSLSC